MVHYIKHSLFLFLFLFLFLLVSPLLLAQDECDYSQEHQRNHLEVIAKRYAGAKLDLGGRVVEWPLKSGGLIIYAYGGCIHFGHRITLVEHLPKLPSKKKVFKKAIKLAKEFWDTPDYKHLKKSLLAGKYKLEKVGLEDVYSIEHLYLVGFNVLHEYQHKENRITIEYMRNF